MHFVVFSHGAICSFVMLMRWRRREEDDNDVNEVKITIRAECFRPIIIHSICKCACHPLCTYCCTFRLQEDCPDAKQLHLPLLAVKGTFFRPLTSALPIICSSCLVLSLQKWWVEELNFCSKQQFTANCFRRRRATRKKNPKFRSGI